MSGPPNFAGLWPRPFGPYAKSAPPLPASGGRFAVPDPLVDNRWASFVIETKEKIIMTTVYSTIRVEFRGQFYAEDELREAIWLANIELRAGLPKDERIEAQHQIADMEMALEALLAAEGEGL
jgi:hypothetical protein